MAKTQALDICSLHAAYANGLSPADVVTICHDRAEAVDDAGIFLHLIDPGIARAEAERLGPFDPVTKPLWGIPFAIKDNVDAADAPTTAACPDFAYVAKRDAFVVNALRKAGAILIGKTNLDQFATGLVGVRTPYPVPRNALDPAVVPGGSSSGSAVAVAQGIVTFALGTDTAGSGRVPAALNGIVGLKPSLGALSNTGVVPACQSLDTLSIFTVTADDAYHVFRSAAVYDPSDSFARRMPSPALGAAPPAFRVGIPSAATLEFFGDAVQAASFADAVRELEAMGGTVTAIDLTPFNDVARMLYDGVWVAERYAVIEDLLKTRPEVVHPVTRQVIEVAEKFAAVDAFRSFYRLQDLKRTIEPVLAGIDFLCVPTIPTFYTCKDLDADPIGPNARLGTYTNFVNLLDMCGMAVPVRPRSDGRPGNITLLAPAGRDAAVAAVAATLQARCAAPLGAAGWPMPPVLERPTMVGCDEIALAVVGAHMSGLPLNAELTRLGARFLRAAKTADSYRLYSLPGGPPTRPGLVQDKTGAAIAIEVWALPSTAFGAFISNVPKPLCIGTLTLDDGAEVKGFLCETVGVDGAEDVTRFGGWRAFLDAQSTSSSQLKESSNA